MSLKVSFEVQCFESEGALKEQSKSDPLFPLGTSVKDVFLLFVAHIKKSAKFFKTEMDSDSKLSTIFLLHSEQDTSSFLGQRWSCCLYDVLRAKVHLASRGVNEKGLNYLF